MDTLTEKVLHYKVTGEGQTELFSQIRVLVYFFPRKCQRWSLEDSSDFFCFFQDRIARIIERFSYQGKSFSSYLSACIRYQMICYQRQEIKHREHREFLLREEESAAEESTHAYGTPGQTQELNHTPRKTPFGSLDNAVTRKKILLLCLKSCYYLDSGTITQLAELLGMAESTLHNLVQELRKDLVKINPKLETLRQKRMELYLMLNFYQKRRYEEVIPEKLPHWNRLCEYYRRRLKHTQKILFSTKVEPRHQDIADLLKIPKGTVDSTLFSLKKQLVKL